MDKDAEHLKLLSVFHYVAGGMTALLALFPIFHLIFGLIMLFLPEKLDSGGDAPPEFVGWILVGVSVVIMGCGFLAALLMAITGRFIARRRHHLFCLIIAGGECLFMPYGTILGVFTIIVLMRDSVKELFAAEARLGPGASYDYAGDP